MSLLAQARIRLAEQYLLGIQAKIEALRVKRDAFSAEEPDVAPTIRRMAHQLRGSGASYGHPRISLAAAIVEDAGDEGLLASLDGLIGVLQETVDHAEIGERSCVVIIEDEADLSTLLEHTLAAADRRIHTATSIAEAQTLLTELRADLVILDLSLPDGDGRNLLAGLQDSPQTADVPVIVLSATAAEQTKTECLTLGAVQFLEKPFAPELISAAVSGVLRRRRRHSEEVRVDSLTGLTNRAGFREEFERAIKLSDRAHLPLALAILDLDHFKQVNDTFGHNTGDSVLREAGALLSRSLRQSDVSARWGGEEFVVLFQNTGATVACSVLSKLADALRGTVIESEGESLPVLTFSGGVVDVAPDDRLDAALGRADKLLYHAKRTGRDRVLEAVPEQSVEQAVRVLLAEDDESMAGLVTASLEAEGFAVSHCADGRSALATALESRHRLVILDRVMPEMDGLEVLRRIRTEAVDKAVPVLMLTGVGREDEIERAFDLGADDYVQKPFKTRELMARVRRLLRQ